MVPIIKWLNPLLPLAFTHFCWVRHLEESRGQLNKPFGIDDSNLTHVLFCCHNQLVIDDPIGLSLEKSTAWVYINGLILNYGPVSFLWVLPCSVKEETGCYCLTYFGEISPSTYNIQFVPDQIKGNLVINRNIQNTGYQRLNVLYS
ncbi:hypothetical protein Hanom_Chr03g00179511 [Helianthus anomalus]